MIPEEPPRRRRIIIDDNGDNRIPRRFPLWLLFPVVVLAGLAIGGGLAKYLGRSPQTTTVSDVVVVSPEPSPTPEITVAPATPSASPVPTPSARVTPRPTPTPRATAEPTVKPTQVPTATAAPTEKPTPRATRTPRPAPSPLPTIAPRRTQPIARREEPSVTPAPAAEPANPAAGVVRSYLETIRRGNFAGAAQYLANGDPNETFIEASSRIQNVSSRRNEDGSYHVTADVTTSRGTYFLTFTVESTDLGQRITEHTAIKPL